MRSFTDPLTSVCTNVSPPTRWDKQASLLIPMLEPNTLLRAMPTLLLPIPTPTLMLPTIQQLHQAETEARRGRRQSRRARDADAVQVHPRVHLVSLALVTGAHATVRDVDVHRAGARVAATHTTAEKKRSPHWLAKFSPFPFLPFVH